MARSSKKVLSVVLTQEHKTFLRKYFDKYVQSPTAAERRAAANIAADGLIAQFAILRKEEALALRAVRISIVIATLP